MCVLPGCEHLRSLPNPSRATARAGRRCSPVAGSSLGGFSAGRGQATRSWWCRMERLAAAERLVPRTSVFQPTTGLSIGTKGARGMVMPTSASKPSTSSTSDSPRSRSSGIRRRRRLRGLGCCTEVRAKKRISRRNENSRECCLLLPLGTAVSSDRLESSCDVFAGWLAQHELIASRRGRATVQGTLTGHFVGRPSAPRTGLEGASSKTVLRDG